MHGMTFQKYVDEVDSFFCVLTNQSNYVYPNWHTVVSFSKQHIALEDDGQGSSALCFKLL